MALSVTFVTSNLQLERTCTKSSTHLRDGRVRTAGQRQLLKGTGRRGGHFQLHLLLLL